MFSDVVTTLRKEQSAAVNIKDRVNRQSVQKTLRSLIRYLTDHVKQVPKHGLCLFWGSETGDRHVIEPPLPLNKNDYVCGRRFYVEPLFQLYADSDEPLSTAVVVVDGESVVIGGFRGGALDATLLLNWQTSISLNKHKQGGQSAPRFGRLASAHRQRFYVSESHMVNTTLQKSKIKNVLLVGPGETKHKIEVHARVIGIETIAHSGVRGLHEAKPLLLAVDQQYALESDDKLFTAFLRALDESRVAFGAEIDEQLSLKNVEYLVNMSGCTPLSARFTRDYGHCAVLYVARAD